MEALDHLEYYLDAIDEYVRGRLKGTIDHQRLHTEEDVRNVLSGNKHLMQLALQALTVSQKIEDYLAKREYDRAEGLLNGIPRPCTMNTWQQVIRKYRDGKGDSVTAGNAELDRRCILQKKIGTDMDIADVMDALVTVASEAKWFVNMHSGIILGKTQLQIVALCLKTGEGRSVGTKKIRSLGKSDGTIKDALQRLRHHCEHSPVHITGTLETGIVLRHKKHATTESA